ncbi:MAG: nicotinamide-nucleotide amidase [Gammaproteobacteria bacterium]|nr:nicotinamide-nucleotide amidase [Gammaproteobacteria bacterium]
MSAYDDKTLGRLARQLGAVLVAQDATLTTAESCTGGFIAKIITDIDGSSQWFSSAVVTYSNRAKQRLLGLTDATLQQHGAVSEAVVSVMAESALQQDGASYAVAVSGIAGPAGGSEDKPVGTVWIGWAAAAQPTHSRRLVFDGDRDAVRRQTVVAALEGVLELAQ